MNYTIYKLLFPNNKVYIGKTISAPLYRWGNGNNYGKTTDIGKAIAEFGWENAQKIILYKNLSYEEACIKEQEMIDAHGGIDSPFVLNERTGGDKGFTLSKELRKKLSIAQKEYYKEHKVSEETKKKQSESITIAHRDHPEAWENARIKIDQYSSDGKTFIAAYDSVYDAERKTGICRRNIFACINGEPYRATAGGYRWYKHGKIYPIISTKKEPGPIKVPVVQMEKETRDIINVYESINEASRQTGICLSDICNCINGKRITAGGYIWEKLK